MVELLLFKWSNNSTKKPLIITEIQLEEIFDINIITTEPPTDITLSNTDDELRRICFGQWLLNGFAVSLLNKSKEIKNRILFEKIPFGRKHLTSIMETMKNGKKLLISYQRFDDDDSYGQEIEPYCLKVFKQRCYLVTKTDQD